MGGVRSVPDAAPKARLPPRAYYALTVLTALNVINVWHRYLIYNLSAVSVEDCDVCDNVSFMPLCFIEEESSSASEEECLTCRSSFNTEFYNLKDGACIDNSQYGILAGVGFTLMFALATLFAGRLTDTLDRRLLHTSAILVWSLSAAAHGTCKSFDCLLVARIFLGVGEAFNAPACYALITLYFPHSRRATANGIYSTGTYLGSAVSSLCLALAVLLGWRNTAFVSGAFGVLAAAVLFFTVEHNPVMPPSAVGYTRLPDDLDPPSPEAYSSAIVTKVTTTTTTTKGHAYGSRGGGHRCSNGGYGSGGIDEIPPFRKGGGGAVPADAAAGYHATTTSLHLKTGSINGYGNGKENGNGVRSAPVAVPNFPGAPVTVASPSASTAAADATAAAATAASPPSSSPAPKTPIFLIVDESPLAGGGVGGGVGGGGGSGSGSGGGSHDPALAKLSGRSRAPAEGKDLRDGGCHDHHDAQPPRQNRLDTGESSVGNPFAQGSGLAESDDFEFPSSRPLLEKSPDDDAVECAPHFVGAGDGGGRGSRNGKEEEEEVDRCACCPTDTFRCRRGDGGGGGRRRRLKRGKSFEMDGGHGCGGGGALAAPPSRYVRGGNTDVNGSGWGWYEDDPSGGSVGRGGRWGDLGRAGEGGEGGGGGGGGGGKHDLGQTLRTIASNRVVLVLFAASSARMVATWSMAGYMAIYYHRAFPSQISLYSVLNAVFVSVGGMASSYGGGAISDRLRIRNEGVLGYLPAFGSAAAILPIAVVLFSRSFGVSVTALFLTYLVGECWLGPGMALLQMELPTEIAGTSVAILLFLNSVICNIGPWFIAWRDSGLDTVRRPMFAVILFSYVSSFFLFTAVGLMVSQKHRNRLEMESIMEDAEGLLEDGEADGPGGGGGGGHARWQKTVSSYFQGSRFDRSVEKNSCGGGGDDGNIGYDNGSGWGPLAPYGAVEAPRHRDRNAVSMCEMVRRTFSGTASSQGNLDSDGGGGDGDASTTVGLNDRYKNGGFRTGGFENGGFAERSERGERREPGPRGRTATRDKRRVRRAGRRGGSGGATVGGGDVKKRATKGGGGGGASESGNEEHEALLTDSWASGEGPGRRV